SAPGQPIQTPPTDLKSGRRAATSPPELGFTTTPFGVRSIVTGRRLETMTSRLGVLIHHLRRRGSSHSGIESPLPAAGATPVRRLSETSHAPGPKARGH